MTPQLKTYDLTDHDQLYFLHIPKTAGISFKTLLASHFEPDRVFPSYFIDDVVVTSPEKLANYQLLAGHFLYSFHLLLPRMPLYLTLLRDPIERSLSQYAHVKRDPHHSLHKKARLQSLLEFIYDPATRPLVENFQTHYLTLNVDPRQIALTSTPDELPHLRTQKMLETMRPSDLSDFELLELAKSRLNACAFVGLTERFNDSLALLSYIFGWHPISALQLNTSSNRLNAAEISAEELTAIRECTQLDAALYTYAEMLFDSYMVQMQQTLLETHYERRVIARSRPKSSVTIDFGRLIQGTGWYPAEFIADHHIAFRWSGPDTTSSLDVRLSTSTNMVIEFLIVHVIAPDILASLVLTANGEPVVLSSRTDALDMLIFRGIIPQTVLIEHQGYCNLVFHINRTHFVKGNDPNDLDSRAIGLAFGWVRLEPENMIQP